jgi:hypothetical protein
MRSLLLFFVLVAMPWTQVLGGKVQLTNVVKASLLFREESQPSAHYPHLLRVYLCLENQHDSDVTWVCNSVIDVEAELLDAKGKPVPPAPGAASILSNPRAYLLPYGSRLEWMLSHGGISMFHSPEKSDVQEECALMVGGRGWLIPRGSLASYSLKLRVRGWPWTRHETVARMRGENILFEVPPTPIVLK